MFMKIIFKTSICVMLLFCKFANAQVPCEFDTSNGAYGLTLNSAGYKIVQSIDKNFLLLSLTNIASSSIQYPFHLKPAITKLDNCGNLLWTLIVDTVRIDNPIDYNITGQFSNMLLEQDESVIYAITYNSINVKLRFVKIDKNGNVKWKYKIGDTTKYYNLNTLIKINTNRYLLTGSHTKYYTNNKQRACIIMADTFGNTIFQKTFNQDTASASNFTYAYKKSANNIILLGNEDSAILIVNIDTLGNVIKLQKITKALGGFKTNGSLIINKDSSELMLSSIITYLPIYLSRLELNGTLIKDTTLNFLAKVLNYLPNNSATLSAGKMVIIIDSNYTITWKDSSRYYSASMTMPINDAIISQDKAIVYIGCSENSSNGNRYLYSLVAKKNIVKYVKSIWINGPNTIYEKRGVIQLSATITPLNASNKNIIWSVNDTNKAVIDQTGLLTAKANGVVIVTATSTDGGNIKGTKTIVITYQNTGMLENLTDLIAVYPNPASNYFVIEFNNVKIKNINLFDITGGLINNIVLGVEKTNHFYLNTDIYSNGFYVLQIETDKGVLKRKIIINK